MQNIITMIVRNNKQFASCDILPGRRRAAAGGQHERDDGVFAIEVLGMNDGGMCDLVLRLHRWLPGRNDCGMRLS